MKNSILHHWSLYIPVIILLFSISLIINVILEQNQGHFTYTYDDTYIHMAMAKNFSAYGVWGITKYAFTSCSSSLAWTALIAFIFFITGPNELVPFIISLVCAVLLLFPFHFIFKREGIKPVYSFLVILLLMYMIFLPFHIISGLEHTMHALITILYVYFAAEIISGLRNKLKDSVILIILAVLLPLLRYEGLVSILLLSVLFLFKRRFALSAGVFLAGTVPVSVFGLVSISKGWSFFPNSMLLKWKSPELTSFGDFFGLISGFVSKLANPLNIVFLLAGIILLAAGFYYYKKHKIDFSNTIIRDFMLIFFYMVNAVMYYIFSRSSFASRYQLFLVALAIFIIPLILFKKGAPGTGSTWIKFTRLASGIAVLLSLIFFGEFNDYQSYINIPRATTNIYEQQYQTGQFLKRYYKDKEIALNDIGTSGYYADVIIADLWGLADFEVSKLRMGNYSKNDLRYLSQSRKIKAAIIYDSWFGAEGLNVIPDEWIKAGEWKIPNNIICGSNIVSIYAVDILEKDNLIRNLKLNSAELPPTVQQSGMYMDGEN